MCTEEETASSLKSAQSIWARPSDIIRWFMPFWFTVSTGTGVLAVCLGRIPYNIAWIHWIGVGVFWLNVVLLAGFTGLLAAQLVFYPQIARFMRQHPQRTVHYGAVPMALATVVVGAETLGFLESGVGVVYVVWGAWWVAATLAMGAAGLLIGLVVTRKTRGIEAVTGAWQLLAAPLMVCAAAGGGLAGAFPADTASATLVCSAVLAGAGAPLTACLAVLYIHRVAEHGLPSHDVILTAFIPLGPIAQIGVAALALGGAVGGVLRTVGAAVALLMWGSAAFWAVLAIVSVGCQRRSACVPFNIGWWALTFPVGVFASLTAVLGDALDIAFFKVGFLVLVAVLAALWLFNAARTIWGIWSGAIFGLGGLASEIECCETAARSGDVQALAC
ncbi:Plasma membrane sulfite pump involved in sulfite metabolism [Coemansia thaxteri]|nr:Plasma membrane sulfite pump involved in sulfite metabolism [Coemansia thaxteri]